MQRVYFILPLCTFSKNNECLFAPVQRRLRDAGRWKNLGEPPIVMKWAKPDPLVGIGFTDLSKIGGANGTPAPPRSCDWFLAPLTFHLNFIKNKSTKKKKTKNGYRLKFCIKNEKKRSFGGSHLLWLSNQYSSRKICKNHWKLHNICFGNDEQIW